ncbi:MAG: hypothetical protein KC476_08405 [Cyanobacteria bacterium HKST-UBA06]|nr:hypothetical protein [Cyanobacteria bacterium HKST-UBA05]MCA9807962.1 hypothetical protein [Cyanobacteria bacterium HKST-UBA06]MCA9840733.1 hypothetical protein [Cyanobacteria bacterium HKST-UBA03]
MMNMKLVTAALAVAIALPSVALADTPMQSKNMNPYKEPGVEQSHSMLFEATTTQDGTSRAKQFVLDEIQTATCHVEKGAVVTYYQDGRIQFDGKIDCPNTADKGNFELEMSFISPSGQEVFDEEFEVDHIRNFHSPTQWTKVLNGTSRRQAHFYQAEKVYVTID